MSLKILLLEDDQDLREELACSLEELGYQVGAAGDGESALEMARQGPFVLVVTDVRMSGLDGLEVLARLRELQSDFVSLVISGYASVEETLRALRLGAGDFLRKPFQRDQFVTAVQRLVLQQQREAAQSRRLHGLSELALWAGRALLRDSRPEMVGRGRQLQQYCLKLGLAEEKARQVELDALYLALWESSAGSEAMPAEVEQRFQELCDGDDAEELNLVDRCLRSFLDLSQAYPCAAVSAPPANQQDRRLIALAYSFLEAGKLQDAQQLCDRLLASSVGAEQVRSRLLQARLLVYAGEPQRSREHLRRALQLAQQTSPLTTAATALEAGEMALGEPVAAEWLEPAFQIFRQFGLFQPAARACLALAVHRGESWSEQWEKALDVLLGDAEGTDLARALPWLLPALLRRAGKELKAGGYLARVARDYPETLARCAKELEEGSRLWAVDALRAAGARAAKALDSFKEDPSPQIRQKVSQGHLASPAQRSRIRLFCLGEFQAFRGDQQLEGWRSQKIRYLLAFLASQERAVSEDVLIETFWAEQPVDRARQNLYTAISTLRKLLKEQVDPIERLAGGLKLNSDLPLWIDYRRLQSELEAAREFAKDGLREAELQAGNRALQLYRGPFLEGCFYDWALSLRERLETEMILCLRQLADKTFESERYDQSLEFASRVLTLDPCCQESHLLLMRLHLLKGRPEQAIRQFEICQRVLKRELGIEPELPLLEAYQRARLR